MLIFLKRVSTTETYCGETNCDDGETKRTRTSRASTHMLWVWLVWGESKALASEQPVMPASVLPPHSIPCRAEPSRCENGGIPSAIWRRRENISPPTGHLEVMGVSRPALFVERIRNTDSIATAPPAARGRKRLSACMSEKISHIKAQEISKKFASKKGKDQVGAWFPAPGWNNETFFVFSTFQSEKSHLWTEEGFTLGRRVENKTKFE